MDIVERLRRMADMSTTGNDLADIERAADALEAKDKEIERLRKRVDEVDRLPDLEWTQASAAIVAEFHKTMRSGDQSAAQKMIAALDLGKVYVTRLRERAERAEAERDALEALGFAHAWCCSLLDRGIDPRKTECGKLLNEWNAAQPSSPPQAANRGLVTDAAVTPAAGGDIDNLAAEFLSKMRPLPQDTPTPLTMQFALEAKFCGQEELVVPVGISMRLERVARQMAEALNTGEIDAEENALAAWRKLNDQSHSS